MNPKKFRGWCATGSGNEIHGNARKYCSLRCCHSVQKRPRKHCLNCRNHVRLYRRYCSLRCMHAHLYTAKAEAFFEQGGVHGEVSAQFLARILREYYGECCLWCGKSQRHPKTGRIPIEVEHIDGDWQNNRLTNLTLLCPNCQSLTPTFRALNRGRGRAHRLGGRGNPLRPHKETPTPDRVVAQEVLREQPMQIGQPPPT